MKKTLIRHLLYEGIRLKLTQNKLTKIEDNILVLIEIYVYIEGFHF